MCGIAGYFGEKELDEKSVRECLALMHRRGPDFSAYKNFRTESGRNAYLLFSRLSIIDLDARSNQPFALGGRTLVFNGEIYNYLELKDDLVQKGHSFRTTSDTEVLIAGLNEYGDVWFDRLEGMWACAVYEAASGTLTLSRDRFGEKPLYLYRDDSGIYFGSETKFIAALLGRKLEVNMNQVFRYLVNGYHAIYKTGETFFEGLVELPPATVCTIAPDGTEALQTYWRPRFAPDPRMSYEEAVDGARERLIRSVELRLRADVPIAFCMSGGVDSNALISIAKSVLGYDVHGFTITNLDERYDETDLVKKAAAALGIRHTSVPADTSDFLPKLATLTRQHDAPVYTISYYAHWLLMERMAESRYRISVSGTAADELFTGYYDHYLAHLAGIKNDRTLHDTALRAWQEHIKPIVRNPFLSDPDLFVKNPDCRDYIFLDAAGFREYLTRAWAEPFSEETYTNDLLRNRMLNEMFYENTPVILHEDDINAMYYSIENRSPYLDRDLFEFCYTIPSRHLIKDGYNKAILRDAMRGIVPDEILDTRRKIGFNASIYSFLDVRDRAVRTQILAASPIFDYVKREKIETLVAKPDLPNSESKFLFYFLTAKMFLEEFLT